MGLAVNVIDVPGQISEVVDTIEISGVTTGFTCIGITLLIAVTGEAQFAVEVRITLILSLLTGICEMEAEVPGKEFQLISSMLLCHENVGDTPP